MTEPRWQEPKLGQIEERRREVEKNKSREEERPHKQHM